MQLVKRLAFILIITMIPGFVLPSSSAQEVTCFGLNCPDDEDYLSFQPGMPNGFSTWDSYATWRGLSAGAHIPNNVPITECFNHCMEHARNAELQCLAQIGIDPDDDEAFICNQVFWSVVNNCMNQCQDNPH